jgi:flagellar basal body-associated protein FliL
MADDETQVEDGQSGDKKPAGRNWLVIALSAFVGVLLLALGLAAGYIFGQMSAPPVAMASQSEAPVDGADGVEVGDESSSDQELSEAIFKSLRPEFTVNFHDGQKERYLMAAIDVMARSQDVIDLVDKNMPVVRYQVLRVLGRQDATLFEEDGKDQLLTEVLAAIQKVIDSPAGNVEAVYLTSFVVQ